jgi:hypothetical protein
MSDPNPTDLTGWLQGELARARAALQAIDSNIWETGDEYTPSETPDGTRRLRERYEGLIEELTSILQAKASDNISKA